VIRTARYATTDGAMTGARIAQPAAISETALVFVHGVGSTAAIWDRQLEAFGDRYRCVAIELRGNGAEPDPDPALITRAGFARDVVTVMDALQIERCTLVGCSLGGVVAFELWQQGHGRFDAMVILGSFARYPDAERYAANVSTAVRDAGNMRVFAERRAAQLGLPPERLHETIEQMACKSVPCYLASTQATWTGDYTSVLSSIAVPALVSYGANDRVAPRELSEVIAAGIPGADLAEVPDAGHVANADNPAAFNALLGDFLQRQTNLP
jgi:pimeloyl-ACP methyl ester carboxylesterase